MESVTYVCYSKEDLAAQSQTFLTEIQNMKTALLKVAENDTNAGTLEEIKALLGMTDDTASEPAKPADSAPTTTITSTDTKTDENADSEANTTESEPTESHTVTVQPGDTLQTLAEKTGATPRHLIDVNMLMEPVVLRPGQTLNY